MFKKKVKAPKKRLHTKKYENSESSEDEIFLVIEESSRTS